MSETISKFNDLTEDEATELLMSCFPSREWAAGIIAGRPYRDVDGLYAAAGLSLTFLSDSVVLAAVASHPRIGERGGREPARSEHEQKGLSDAAAETMAAIAAENRAYEERFGHVFLIAAAGRSADEILGELRRRIRSDPRTEMFATKRELHKIAVGRLEHWFST